MTCPSLLRRYPAARLVDWLRRDDVLAQFARFVFVGGLATATFALLFIALDGFGYLTANICAGVVSTVLANDLHRRLTFRADDRIGFWPAQLEAGGVSVFGLAATSLALSWLHAGAESAPAIVQIALVVAVNGAVGTIRFVALRWIFRPAEEPVSR